MALRPGHRVDGIHLLGGFRDLGAGSVDSLSQGRIKTKKGTSLSNHHSLNPQGRKHSDLVQNDAFQFPGIRSFELLLNQCWEGALLFRS